VVPLSAPLVEVLKDSVYVLSPPAAVVGALVTVRPETAEAGVTARAGKACAGGDRAIEAPMRARLPQTAVVSFLPRRLRS